MIASFILGALATWGAPQLEPQIKGWLERVLPLDDMTAVEMRGISVALLLSVAAILATLMGSANALSLGIGGLVGVLGPRGYQRFRQTKAPDYDS